jgi:acyl-CoA-binding protein
MSDLNFPDGKSGSLKNDINLRFEKAVEEVKSTSPSDADKLKLYGLYKQIIFGKNNQAKPWSFKVADCYKWQAWKDCEGMDKEKCMQLYIDFVNKLKK